MIILVGTPRSGTSYLYYWHTNKYRDYTHHQYDYGGEYFHPWFMEGDETEERLTHLTDTSIIKVLTGPEINPKVWDYIKEKEVITVGRKNKLEQFCSYGIASHTNSWRNQVTSLDLKIEYKKEWFQELEQYLFMFRDIYGEVPNIWYEDILEKYPPQKGMYLPKKQNSKHLDSFINAEEVLGWYQEYSKK